MFSIQQALNIFQRKDDMTLVPVTLVLYSKYILVKLNSRNQELKGIKTFKLGFGIVAFNYRKKKFLLLEILNLYQAQVLSPFLKKPSPLSLTTACLTLSLHFYHPKCNCLYTHLPYQIIYSPRAEIRYSVCQSINRKALAK